jgi:hypothetical protein
MVVCQYIPSKKFAGKLHVWMRGRLPLIPQLTRPHAFGFQSSQGALIKATVVDSGVGAGHGDLLRLLVVVKLYTIK